LSIGGSTAKAFAVTRTQQATAIRVAAQLHDTAAEKLTVLGRMARSDQAAA
jgi:hypothetical protein